MAAAEADDDGDGGAEAAASPARGLPQPSWRAVTLADEDSDLATDDDDEDGDDDGGIGGGSVGSVGDSAPRVLECLVCRKVFKSEGQMAMHVRAARTRKCAPRPRGPARERGDRAEAATEPEAAAAPRRRPETRPRR